VATRTLPVLACLTLWATAAFAQGAVQVGKGDSPPSLISKTEPEYTEEARQARLIGTVVLYIEVYPDGRAHNMKVIRSLGLGLDEQAMATVERWEFRPGEKEGKRVAVRAVVEVNFRLLPGRANQFRWQATRVVFQIPPGAARPVLTESPYPPSTRTEPGSATVALTIDESGQTSELRTEKASDPKLGDEALKIVRGWRFNPAMQDGQPVASTGRVQLIFGPAVETPKPAASRTSL
jgi:TonB family protein